MTEDDFERGVTWARKVLERIRDFPGNDPTEVDYYPTPFASGWETAIEEALARLENESRD
jgi:hypothetical protein